MENQMETTIMENQMEKKMENEMEAGPDLGWTMAVEGALVGIGRPTGKLSVAQGFSGCDWAMKLKASQQGPQPSNYSQLALAATIRVHFAPIRGTKGVLGYTRPLRHRGRFSRKQTLPGSFTMAPCASIART